MKLIIILYDFRLMVQGDGSEQITLPHGMMPPTF